MIRCAFQSDTEMQEFECDGLLMIPLWRADNEELKATPIAVKLSTDEVARLLLATYAEVRQEITEAK